jgi:uncharacterized protein YbaR (Trm112 family)
MSIDRRLLENLCCPVSRLPVRPLSATQIDAVNRAIEAGAVVSVNGAPVKLALREGLISQDNKVIYPIIDGIPVMLADEGIGTPQLTDFPH